MPETMMQHHQRRAAALGKLRKAELCVMYRRLGGLGGIHPPESWRKDEVITSITEMEWSRLPADQKLPDPPRMSPPCNECGAGQDANAHKWGGSHHYTTGGPDADPDAPWVPVSQAEAERITRDFPEPNARDHEDEMPVGPPSDLLAAEEQPEQPAKATVLPFMTGRIFPESRDYPGAPPCSGCGQPPEAPAHVDPTSLTGHLYRLDIPRGYLAALTDMVSQAIDAVPLGSPITPEERGHMMWLDAGDSVRLTLNSSAGPLLDQTLAYLSHSARIDPQGEVLRYTYSWVDEETGETHRRAARIVIEELDMRTAPGSHNPRAAMER